MPDTLSAITTLPVYVLNLDRRADRMALTRRVLLEAGWLDDQIVRIPGVDGLTIPPAEVDAYRPTLKPESRDHAEGKLGCLRGHQRFARTAMDRNEFPIVFVQDDIEALAPLDSTPFPDRWDILLLGGIGSSGVELRYPWTRVRRWFRPHAMVLRSPFAAERLLTEWMREQGNADHSWHGAFRDLHVMAPHRSYFGQRQGISDIEGTLRPRRK